MKTNDTRPQGLYLIHPTMETQVVRVALGTPGFWPIKRCQDRGEAETLARALNLAERYPDTPAMREAMLAGSMFGWDVPGAYPEAYQKREKFACDCKPGDKFRCEHEQD